MIAIYSLKRAPARRRAGKTFAKSYGWNFRQDVYKRQGLPYAVFISAGNDGAGALSGIERIARGYPLKPVCDPIIARGELNAAILQSCEDLGETMASGVAWGVF